MKTRYFLLFIAFSACVIAARYIGEGEVVHENLPTQVETTVESSGETKLEASHFAPRISLENTKAFEAYTQKTLLELPSPQDLRRHPEISVHFTPAIVTSMAPKISRIQEQMQIHPELVTTGVRFYEACASHPDTFVAVRALCLHLHRSWVGERHLAVPKEVTMAAEALRGINP